MKAEQLVAGVFGFVGQRTDAKGNNLYLGGWFRVELDDGTFGGQMGQKGQMIDESQGDSTIIGQLLPGRFLNIDQVPHWDPERAYRYCLTPEKEAPDYFAGDWFEFHSLWVPTGRTGKARLKICGYVPPL